MSLIENEIQTHGAVIQVSWYTTYIWYVKLTSKRLITIKFLGSSMVITFRLATAKRLPYPGWNLTLLPPTWNLYYTIHCTHVIVVIQFWILKTSVRLTVWLFIRSCRLTSHALITPSASDEQRIRPNGWKSSDLTLQLWPTKLDNAIAGYTYISWNMKTKWINS